MFRIPGKIPILIHPFFWVTAFLIGWLSTSNVFAMFIWAAVILVSVLVHEFGHALTAIAFGQKARIELIGFGGVTQRRGGDSLKLWKEFIIVFNGPLAGLCLAGVCWLLYRKLSMLYPGTPLTYALGIAFEVNVFWTILNLLPVQPLDGGKLLSIFMESLFGLKGIKIALFISLLFAVAFGATFFVMQWYLAGAFFMLFAYESYKSWKESLELTQDDKDAALQHLIKDAESALHRGNKVEALEQFQRIREKSKGGLIYQVATENAAHLLAEQGDLKQAYDMISSLGKKVSSDGINLWHQLAYQFKQWEEAASIGDKAYKIQPNYQTAFINAAANASLGNVKPAIGWLQCSINDGLPNPQQALAGKDFDPIRNDPVFRAYLEEIH
jgi:stage IV sporulation protein FB